MWIRSQDKTKLIKAEFIRISGNEIVATCSDIPATKIGEYSSQEKALKVLDLIEHYIERNNSHRDSHYNRPQIVYDVFQMPLDSDVPEIFHFTEEDRNTRV